MPFNLHKNTYKPYRKPDNQPVYIHVNSNHPPTTIRELLKSIGKRLSELSCNKEIFEKAIPPYNDALKKSRLKENLVYKPKTTIWYIHLKPPFGIYTENHHLVYTPKTTIWFSLLYSVNVKTNLEKEQVIQDFQ